MRRAAAILTLLLATTTPSLAQDDICGWFTRENRPFGEVIARVQGYRILEVRNQYAETRVYDLISAGTGIPFQVGVRRDDRDSGDRPSVRMHKGDLLIDGVAYTPMCEKGGRVDQIPR